MMHIFTRSLELQWVVLETKSSQNRLGAPPQTVRFPLEL